MKPAAAILLAATLVAGCSEDDEPEAASCDVIALNRNVDDSEGKAEIVMVSTDGEVELVTDEWVATRPALSPDGRHLAFVKADGDYESGGPDSTSVWVIDADGSAGRQISDGQAGDAPAWSPDGQRLAYIDYTDGPRLVTVTADGGDKVVVVDEHPFDRLVSAWFPDGERLAVAGYEFNGENARSSIWTVSRDGASKQDLAEITPDVHTLDWHPDGASLLVSTFALEDGNVHVVDLESGDARRIGEHATFAAWSVDGERIYYFENENLADRSSWRLAVGHVDDGRLERDRYVGDVRDYLYPYFGLDVGPCP